MDEQLEQIIKDLDIDQQYYPLFKDISFEKAVYIKKNKKYYIHLKTSSLPSPTLYYAFLQIKEKFNHSCEVVLTYDDGVVIDKMFIKKVINEVILKKHEKNAIVQTLKDNDFHLDDHRISFYFESVIKKDGLSNYKNDFQGVFNLIGINRILDFVVVEDELKNQKVSEELEKEKEEKVQQAIIENDNKKSVEPKKNYYQRRSAEHVDISSLTQNDKNVIIIGKIFAVEHNERKRLISLFYLTDYNDSISVKCFEGSKFTKEDLYSFKENDWVEVKGNMEYDTFLKEDVLMASSIKKIDYDDEILDESKDKRVELHLHTKMSSMDGVSSPLEYINQAIKWGHKAIAITDHGVVQAFPDAYAAAKGKPIKVIYGMEAYVVDDLEEHIMNPSDINLEDATYIVFDLETTGLSSRTEQIIEIGAVKVKNGMVIDRFQTFVNPEKKLSSKIIEITNINDDMLKNAPKIESALPSFLSFMGDGILVAHNAVFDIAFLKESISRLGFSKLTNPVIDTLPLSRVLYSESKSHSLGSISRRMNIEYDEEVAHRADYDARVLYNVLEVMLRDILDKYEIKIHRDLLKIQKEDNYARKRPVHMVILAKNQAGIKDLYKLVSTSSIDYYSDTPRIPRRILQANRENLLIGSACFKGEIFDIASTKNHKELVEAIKFYDYIEIQPLDNYSFLVDTNAIESNEKLSTYLKFIIDASKEANKLVVATGDAHYVSPNQKIFRDIYITAQAIGGKHHPLYDFKKRVKQNPNQHFRSTSEMLKCYPYLSEEETYEIVVKNTNLIADMIEEVKPLKEGTYSPKIEGAEEELTKICYENAHRIYGENLPEIVEKRVDKELSSIINNGFAVIYYIAHKLVKKSVDEGYLVGSRGSVGSSLVAYLTGITEVNALPPHYICDNCKYSDFSNEEKVYSGYDLSDKSCPKCGMPLKGDGQNIPFETFLGFKGDKVPDIDLNFSGEYQAIAHEHTKELFGEDYVYRAGTIGTVADKTSYGYVKGYFEETGNLESVRKAHLKYLSKGCDGVKRTTSQHPGGIIVIPNSMDVHDFTPIQYPADSLDANWKTTHFDFHAIHDNVLKLDILGHVDPTALRMLQNMTGINPQDIPCNDKKVLSLFNSCEALNVTKEEILNENGATGIPEFGTDFVKRMLIETKPTSFAELVQISGLSHGTDVWSGNAQELIKSKSLNLMDLIGCRDDIMVYLISKGLDNSTSFKIMESVRKGKGLTPEFEAEMKKHDISDWYIDSCKKIKYMFPKAHAAAYVTMAIRVAWFKVYRPLEYYATYFSTRCNAYDIATMIKGKDAILERFLYIKSRKEDFETSKDVKAKEEAILSTLENALEMTARGFKFSNIDLYKSEATNFIVDYETNTILPPFSSVDGLGEAAAKSVVEARKQKEFLSIEDLLSRTQINSTTAKTLEKMGVLSSLQPQNQLEFDLF